MITLTEKAIKRALQVSERQKIPAVLRVGVKGGGCSGLSYFLDFEEGEGREGDVGRGTYLHEKGQRTRPCAYNRTQYVPTLTSVRACSYNLM